MKQHDRIPWFKPRYLLVMLGLFSIGVAQAQEKKASGTIRIQCVCYKRVGNNQQIFISGSEHPEKRQETSLPLYTLSKPVRVNERSIRVYAEPFTKESPDKPLATVKLPARGNRFVLFFMPAKPGGKSVYHVKAVDGNPSKFRGGDQYFVNLSSSEIRGRFGGKVFQLKAWSTLLHKTSDKITKDGSPSPIVLLQKVVETSKPPSWEPFCSSRWRVDERIRTIVLIFNDLKSGKLSYRGITERVDLQTPES